MKYKKPRINLVRRGHIIDIELENFDGELSINGVQSSGGDNPKGITVVRWEISGLEEIKDCPLLQMRMRNNVVPEPLTVTRLPVIKLKEEDREIIRRMLYLKRCRLESLKNELIQGATLNMTAGYDDPRYWLEKPNGWITKITFEEYYALRKWFVEKGTP